MNSNEMNEAANNNAHRIDPAMFTEVILCVADLMAHITMRLPEAKEVNPTHIFNFIKYLEMTEDMHCVPRDTYRNAYRTALFKAKEAKLLDDQRSLTGHSLAIDESGAPWMGPPAIRYYAVNSLMSSGAAPSQAWSQDYNMRFRLTMISTGLQLHELSADFITRDDDSLDICISKLDFSSLGISDSVMAEFDRNTTLPLAFY